MDAEVVFTFLTREDSVTTLTFLTAQMSVKQGIKQFGKSGADTVMSEQEQLIYCKVRWRAVNQVNAPENKNRLLSDVPEA